MKYNPFELVEKALLLIIALATLFAVTQEIVTIMELRRVRLSDLLLLFIYAEVISMVGAYYQSKRIPVTLPIIIAITALSRMIILQEKDYEPVLILYETLGVLFLSLGAVVMTVKDKISLEKLKK